MVKIVNRLTWVVATLTILIALGAFILSYEALLQVGKTSSIFSDRWVWIFPLLIDFPLAVFTLALLNAQINRQPVRGWVGLVLLYTAATIAFNLSHARPDFYPNIIGWLVAVVAPVGLLLTTEALRHLVKTVIDRQVMVNSLEDVTAQVSARQLELNTLRLDVEQLATRRDELTALVDRLNEQAEAMADKPNPAMKQMEERQRRLETMLDYLVNNPFANVNQAAQHLEVTRQTAGNYIRELTASGRLSKNGNGWKVSEQ